MADLAAGEPGSVAVGTDTYEHDGSLDSCGCPVDSHFVFGALWMASLCVSVDTLALHLVSSAWSPPRGGSACRPMHSGSCQEGAKALLLDACALAALLHEHVTAAPFFDKIA